MNYFEFHNLGHWELPAQPRLQLPSQRSGQGFSFQSYLQPIAQVTFRLFNLGLEAVGKTCYKAETIGIPRRYTRLVGYEPTDRWPEVVPSSLETNRKFYQEVIDV